MPSSRNLLALALFVFASPALARLTAPGANDADIVCWGPTGMESCLDKTANLIPTTDNTQTLGTSALRWANIYGVTLTAGVMDISNPGTALAPALYIDTIHSNGLGLFASSPNVLGIATNGTKRATINAAGRLDYVGGEVGFVGPSPWVDVMEYGAAGDGVTDDTLAIQAAVNATSGTVVFPCGHAFVVTSTITVSNSSEKLVGCGSIGGNTPVPTTHIEAEGPAGAKYHVFWLTGLNNEIRDLTVDGTISKGTVTASGVLAEGFESRIINSAFVNLGGDGMDIGCQATVGCAENGFTLENANASGNGGIGLYISDDMDGNCNATNGSIIGGIYQYSGKANVEFNKACYDTGIGMASVFGVSTGIYVTANASNITLIGGEAELSSPDYLIDPAAANFLGLNLPQINGAFNTIHNGNDYQVSLGSFSVLHGWIGIGTGNANNDLDIEGAADTQGILISGFTTARPAIDFGNASYGALGSIVADTTTTGGFLTIRTSGDGKNYQQNIDVTISNNGNVAIAGVASAASFLGVSGATETTTAALTGVGTVANPLAVNSSSVAVLSSSLVLNSQIDGSSVTKQGNTFNGNSQLVKTTSGGSFAIGGTSVTNTGNISLTPNATTNITTIGAPITTLGGGTATSTSFSVCLATRTITTNGGNVFVALSMDAKNTTLADGCELWVLQDGNFIWGQNAAQPIADFTSATNNAINMLSVNAFVDSTPAAGAHSYCYGIGVGTAGSCSNSVTVKTLFSVFEAR